MPIKKKPKVPFEEELNEAVRKGRWMPLGGKRVAAVLALLVIAILIGVPFFPQMVSESPLRFGGKGYKLETYPPAEEDPRRIAWVGNDSFVVILRSFTLDLRLPVQHSYFGNCSSLLSEMRNSGYYAHLYVLSPVTFRNQFVGEDGSIYDASLFMDYSAADCGVSIRSLDISAKILCLVEGMDTTTANECLDEGFFILTPEEAVSQDALVQDVRMSIAESTIRDLIELPLNPDDVKPPDDLPDDWYDW